MNPVHKRIGDTRRPGLNYAVLLKTSEYSQLILDGGYDIRITVDWNDVSFYAKFQGGYSFNVGLTGELDFEGSDTFAKKLCPTGDDDGKPLGRFSVCGIPLRLDFRLDGTATVAAQATGSFSTVYSNRRSHGSGSRCTAEVGIPTRCTRHDDVYGCR